MCVWLLLAAATGCNLLTTCRFEKKRQHAAKMAEMRAQMEDVGEQPPLATPKPAMSAAKTATKLVRGVRALQTLADENALA